MPDPARKKQNETRGALYERYRTAEGSLYWSTEAPQHGSVLKDFVTRSRYRKHRYRLRPDYVTTRPWVTLQPSKWDRLRAIVRHVARWSREGIPASAKPEQLLQSLKFFIPRKHREALLGDLVEDAVEQRTAGHSELRIRLTLCWQLFLAARGHIFAVGAWALSALQKIIAG